MLPLTYPLTLAAVLFGLGLYGALTQRNAIRILMCVEIMLNAANINLVAFSRYITPEQATGQIFALFVMAVAAAEVSLALAIIVTISRRRKHVDLERINMLRW